MSTGCECLFIEHRPGEWYYILEGYNAPKNSWDWREYAQAYGPFCDEEETNQHLGRHHANPGGYSIQYYDPTRKPDEVQNNLIAEARRRTSREAQERLALGWPVSRYDPRGE